MICIGLNISHNCSACVIKDGEIIAAIAGERISRIKYFFEYGDSKKALYYLLSKLRLTPKDIDVIGINYGDFVPDIAIKKGDLFHMDYKLDDELIKTVFFNHHKAHAASAFFSSGFKDSLIMVSDARGSSEKEKIPLKESEIKDDDGRSTETISFYLAEKDDIRLIERYTFPYSFGELYSLITAYLGFNRHSHEGYYDFNEGKTMGLAPYGADYYEGESLIFLNRKGFDFNSNFIDGSGRFLRLTEDFYRKFGAERKPDEEILSGHKLAAYVVQNDLEKVCHYLIERQRYKHDCKNIVFAGGSFLNCVMNGKLKRALQFDGFYVFPAADDSGLAIGNAYLACGS